MKNGTPCKHFIDDWMEISLTVECKGTLPMPKFVIMKKTEENILAQVKFISIQEIQELFAVEMNQHSYNTSAMDVQNHLGETIILASLQTNFHFTLVLSKRHRKCLSSALCKTRLVLSTDILLNTVTHSKQVQ